MNGGLELIVWNLACGLTTLGHKVVVFATTESKIPPKGFLYECCEPEQKVHTDWLKAEREMWQVYKDKLEDFDIINSHDWFGFCYASKAENPKLKCTHTHHGGLSDWWKRSPPPFKLNLIAISDWMVKVYASQGFTAKRVYNGVNMEKYKFREEGGERLMFLGRISKIKAPHIAVEVAKKTGLGLDIVGGTSFVDDPSYVDYVRGLCDGDQIRFVGEVDHETKVKYLQNAKALLVPSQFGEPFGLISVESMAVGTIPICLLDGAIPEVVKNGVTGFVCKDVSEMVKAVKNIHQINPRKCRKRAKKLFSREVMAENYLKLYRNILEGKEW